MNWPLVNYMVQERIFIYKLKEVKEKRCRVKQYKTKKLEAFIVISLIDSCYYHNSIRIWYAIFSSILISYVYYTCLHPDYSFSILVNILSNNYLKEVCFAYAYIIHPPLDTKHHSYDSIMFKIAQNKAWNLTRINNAAGAFQNNTFFMF